MEIQEPKPPGTLWATLGLLQDCFTVFTQPPWRCAIKSHTLNYCTINRKAFQFETTGRIMVEACKWVKSKHCSTNHTYVQETTEKPVQPKTTHNTYTLSTTYQLKYQNCLISTKDKQESVLNKSYKNT
jgi:hypothetical protein